MSTSSKLGLSLPPELQARVASARRAGALKEKSVSALVRTAIANNLEDCWPTEHELRALAEMVRAKMTTVSLPAELHDRVRERARRLGCPDYHLVIILVRTELERRKVPKAGTAPPLVRTVKISVAEPDYEPFLEEATQRYKQGERRRIDVPTVVHDAAQLGIEWIGDRALYTHFEQIAEARGLRDSTGRPDVAGVIKEASLLGLSLLED